MTIAVDLGRKATKQKNYNNISYMIIYNWFMVCDCFRFYNNISYIIIYNWFMVCDCGISLLYSSGSITARLPRSCNTAVD